MNPLPGNVDIQVTYSSELGSGWYVSECMKQKVYFEVDKTGGMEPTKTINVGTVNIPKGGHHYITLRPVGDGTYNPTRFHSVRLSNKYEDPNAIDD